MAKSLMLVGDSATMRKIIMRIIQMSGLTIDRIEEANDGNEALAKLQDGSVNVMLCDINMPGMSGTELVKKIRENDTFSDVKIVMVSTESSDEVVEKAKADGANGYITKPFTPEKIQKELAPLMS